MNYYKRIIVRQPSATEEQVREFVRALEAGEEKSLAECNCDWVAFHCFTDLARENYCSVKVQTFLSLARDEKNWKP